MDEKRPIDVLDDLMKDDEVEERKSFNTASC
jgi:hypothetical protein